MNNDFPMLKTKYTYLDNSATSWKPESVLNSINKYYTEYTANAHRGDYDFSLKVDNEYEHARKIVKDFLNAKSTQEIIFTYGATDSLNMVANGYFKNILTSEDEILLSKSEHASNVLPWFAIHSSNGTKINYIPLDEQHHITIDNVIKSITPNTKVIALALVTNVIGDLRPIKEICHIAHERGIQVVVDAAQAAPHIKIDVQDLDCDFLVFSGHKMCGPTGIGVLYGKLTPLNNVIPVRLGGGMNESFDNEDEVILKELPARLEAGTPNIEGAIGLGAAIEYINSIGLSNIAAHEIELRKYCISKLKEIPHIEIYNEIAEAGIISFNVKDIFAQDVAIYLNKYHICLRAGNHCAKMLKDIIGVKNTLRISLYIYNTKEDIDRLVSLLKDKDKILKEML